MAATATPDLLVAADPLPAKKGRSRKALKEKNPSTNEANILAAKATESPAPVLESDPSKENHESLSQPKSAKKKSKAKSKVKQSEASSNFEKDLQEMQEMLEKMKIEKEKTEEMLKEKDEMLKQKEEEIETRGKEQQKLQTELKKLQKMKDFKPTMNLPITQCLKDKEVEKKDKKKKDCPEKKRPASAYALWCKDQWNEIKKENPDADFKEVSTLMGAKWKSLKPEEKKPYEEKYQAEKEAYLLIVGKEKRESEALKLLDEEQKQKTAMELLDQYLQFKQEAEKENTKKSKKEKDPSKPKQPIGAFFLYSNERRGALLAEGKNILEASKVISEEWKIMTEEQKLPYEKIAKEKKEKYQQEMELYKQKKEEEAAHLKKEEDELMKIHKAEAMQLLKKKEKADNIIKKTKDLKKKQKDEKVAADPNKPKRPASSYILFSKEERKNLVQERPDINNSTINALISLKWKELNEEEKKVWNEKAAEGMVAYKKELEEYNKQASKEKEAKSQS